MTTKQPPFPKDKTAAERRKGLSEAEIKDLELAGGVEGGMRAGHGGPSAKEEDNGKTDPGDDPGSNPGT